MIAGVLPKEGWMFYSHIRRFRNNCEIVEESNSSGKNRVRVKFHTHYSFKMQTVIDIKFLNYSGNVYWLQAQAIWFKSWCHASQHFPVHVFERKHGPCKGGIFFTIRLVSPERKYFNTLWWGGNSKLRGAKGKAVGPGWHWIHFWTGLPELGTNFRIGLCWLEKSFCCSVRPEGLFYYDAVQI